MPKRKPTGDKQEAEADLQTCPICLEPIAKRAAVNVSRCQPVPHVMHARCWQRQTQRQQERCCVCRQLTVDDLTFTAVAELCDGSNPMREKSDEEHSERGNLTGRIMVVPIVDEA